MNSTNPKEVVINAWKTFKTRDARLIARLLPTPNGSRRPEMPRRSLSSTPTMIGPNQIAHFIASEMHHPFSNVDISFRGIHADGDTVVVAADPSSEAAFQNLSDQFIRLPTGGRC